MNYNLNFKEIVSAEGGKGKTLLLHSCCAVCSSYVLSLAARHFDTTVLYYNPNIYPRAEYEKRKSEQIRIIDELYAGRVKYIDFDYDHGEFLAAAKGFEAEPEGGLRCAECFRLRLGKTAETAEKLGFDYFGTTLTVSPHKNSAEINEIGERLSLDTGIKWLYSDFKKENGYLLSSKIAEQYSIYRQNYCGCEFALREQQ